MVKSKTVKFRLNEKFLFGAPRCIRCGKPLRSGEFMTCDSCKAKLRRSFG